MLKNELHTTCFEWHAGIRKYDGPNLYMISSLNQERASSSRRLIVTLHLKN